MKTDFKDLLTPELKDMVFEHYQLVKHRFVNMESYVENLVENILKSQKLHQEGGNDD
ncbi:MAG: hypothetical protein JRF72_19075 [Deltaproteobacteria bacterium]|jgi:hypothetical protein|nr:hypothetical protein [Deltaproteobacteria bacterium]